MMDDYISRQAAIDAIPHKTKGLGGESWMMTYRRSGHNDCVDACLDAIRHLPSAQPEITDEQAVEHLQASGWMQNHDKQMYEMGLRERLADDSDSYDALLPSAQTEPCEDAVSRKLMYELGATCMAKRDENGELVALGRLDMLPSAQTEEDCDTCKHGYFGDDQCNNCRVRYPSHYERRTDEQDD